MNYILFDDQKVRRDLLPLTFTRPVADIRFGINTMREKWERILGAKTSSLTEPHLLKKFPVVKGNHNILINSSVCPSEKLLAQIKALGTNQALVGDVKVIAMNLSGDNLDAMDTSDAIEVKMDSETTCINNVWDLFSKLDVAINNLIEFADFISPDFRADMYSLIIL